MRALLCALLASSCGLTSGWVKVAFPGDRVPAVAACAFTINGDDIEAACTPINAAQEARLFADGGCDGNR